MGFTQIVLTAPVTDTTTIAHQQHPFTQLQQTQNNNVMHQIQRQIQLQQQQQQQLLFMNMMTPNPRIGQSQITQKPIEYVKIFWDYENCPLSTYAGSKSLESFNNDITTKIDSVLTQKLSKVIHR